MPSDASHLERIENPWLRAFLCEPWEEIVLGQILIRRVGNGFELRHIEGAIRKEIRLSDARAIANFNAAGDFRPLKSTRELPSGWLLRANSPEELELALGYFYPNAIADWFAIRNGVTATDYRVYTSRQTGMYRITTFLDDAGVARVIERTCNSICLKRRFWTVGQLSCDAPDPKSIIPCLEPCAILMEAARKDVRALQEKSASAAQAESATEPE
jgi:hypothetical protein